MPKLIFPEQFDTQIEPDIKLGYRTTGPGKTWYARIYWRNGEKNSYYTLKTPYKPSQASFRLASTDDNIRFIDRMTDDTRFITPKFPLSRSPRDAIALAYP
jgi:hypothetical protein